MSDLFDAPTLQHPSADSTKEPAARSYSEAEQIARLRLIRSENVGPITFHRLIRTYKTASRALDALPGLANAGGRKQGIRIASVAQAEQEYAAAMALGASILHYGSSTYPTYLTETEDAPPILFAMGQTDLCNKPPLAMVGTRHASTAGKNFAHDLARATAQAGFCIVSGMARGIDAAVHVGALPYGTIAVLAGGIDVIYPKENTKLYHALASRGLILSEAPIGTTPQARHFPSRNRIIAGISLGTLVFEAALRSGSLITARMAADYGREVLAIPGHPADGRAAGGNALLKDGAALVENVDDIIQHMADILANPTMHMQFTTATQHSKATTTQVPPRNTGALANPSALLESPRSSTTHADQSTACRHWVMDTLGTTPTTQDDLIRQSKRAPATIATALLELELAGKIERRPGGVIAPTAFVRNNA